jgi:hypothetical protein
MSIEFQTPIYRNIYTKNPISVRLEPADYPQVVREAGGEIEAQR